MEGNKMKDTYASYAIIELEQHQERLLTEFAEVILDGTVEQAESAFEIIFEREPSELDLLIFRELCIEKQKEKEGKHYGIRGVISWEEEDEK